MALGGIQDISPDVRLFYQRKNNSAEEAFRSLSLSLPLPFSPFHPPFLRNITEMMFSSFRWSYCQLLAMTLLSKKFYRQLVLYLDKYSFLLS